MAATACFLIAATCGSSSADASASDRVVTRNAISITQTLPLSYKGRIEQVPGVSKVTFSNWFGGIYKDRRNFFAQFAVDAESALQVFSIRFVAGTKEGWLADRNSAIVGKLLADKYGWKIGDVVPLIGDVYPGDWQFKVAGIVEGADDESIGRTMYIHFARLNEGLPAVRKDQVGVFTETIANASDSPRIARAIDDLFANSDNETHTETEKAFRLQFVSGSSAILTALEAVSAVILLIMALILGNTVDYAVELFYRHANAQRDSWGRTTTFRTMADDRNFGHAIAIRTRPSSPPISLR